MLLHQAANLAMLNCHSTNDIIDTPEPFKSDYHEKLNRDIGIRPNENWRYHLTNDHL